MSTQGKRDFRPRFHFTPPTNWMNDPNGMVYENGTYHLFYQHDPNSTVPQTMHWGHAVSSDLLTWQHRPVAIAPDELGVIFSGSAVYDEHNTSGLGTDGQAPIVAMYTSHGECEQQSIAYSLDGIHFTKYDHNPVIKNPGITDFRDPKLFWNPVRNGWSLVLAAKDRVHFYASDNLLDWHKTGEFGPEGNKAPGIWECPDLFPLPTKNGDKWVLLVSMTTTPEQGQIIPQYFIGDFDGNTFINSQPFDEVARVDEGFDHYAGVTFQNAPERIFLAWASNWGYAAQLPTGDYCGQMSLARSLKLVKTPDDGLRLGGKPLLPADQSESEITPRHSFTGKQPLTSETFRLVLTVDGPSEIILKNPTGQMLTLGVNQQNEFYINRSKAGADDFHSQFQMELYQRRSYPRFFNGSYQLDLIFDVSVVEAFIDQGTRSYTALVFPNTPYNTISVTGGSATIIML